MKRRDEIVVGATILLTLVLVVLGAIWMSETQLGALGEPNFARFRTVGGLGVGNPVVLRGVRVGRVQEIRLGEGEWVETVFQINPDIVLPEEPAIVAASASLFGEWQAGIISLKDEIEDPNVRRELREAADAGPGAWPGATLPDIGQLTAQAGRIATDIASFSNRIETAFDEEVVLNLQRSIRDFSETADNINAFAGQQTEILGGIAVEFQETSGVVSSTARALERTMARIDSATAEGRLDTLVNNASEISTDLRSAVDGFRGLVDLLADRQPSIDRIVGGADSVMTRLGEGSGTIGRLVGDSTLYVEASKAIQEFRELLADIKENPRKYFKFSVF